MRAVNDSPGKILMRLKKNLGQKNSVYANILHKILDNRFESSLHKKRKVAQISCDARPNYPFTVEDDDNSDAEIVCHIINDKCSQVTTSPLSLEGTTISTSSLLDSPSTASVVQRRRSPRNLPAYDDEETSSGMQPSSLNFGQPQKRCQRSTTTIFSEKWESIEGTHKGIYKQKN